MGETHHKNKQKTLVRVNRPACNTGHLITCKALIWVLGAALPPALLSLGTESAVYPTPAAKSKKGAEQKLHPHLPRYLLLPNSGSTKVKFWTLKFPWAPLPAGRWGHDPTVGTP